MRELVQQLTYEGLLEGLPTTEMNKGLVDSLVESSAAGSSLRPYLIPPMERAIEHGGRYPFGVPASLPAVACVARFSSTSPARDRTKDYSSLRIIWFQEDFAFPIDPDVLRTMIEVPWEERAHDEEY